MRKPSSAGTRRDAARRDRGGRRRGATRRWCIPLAVLREPDETLEGTEILAEHKPGLGVILWSVYRDVTLWAAVSDETRPRLFNANAFQRRKEEINASGAEPRLEMALSSLTSIAANAEDLQTDHVTTGCRLVAAWAEEHCAMATAVAFAQAAALASPDDAAAAVNAGRILRAWGRDTRADTWLRRGVGLARRGRDTYSYTQGLVLLGDIFRDRQQLGQARHYYTMGFRAGRRHGLPGLRGEANHGLLLCYMVQGEKQRGEVPDDSAASFAAAERHGRVALRAYQRTHARLGELLHDLARLWILQGNHGRAIPALQRLLHTRIEPSARAFTLALIAQAAAGTGETGLYQEAWSGAYSLLNRTRELNSTDERAVLALVRAAMAKRDWPRVDQARQLYRPAPGSKREVAAELAALAARAREPNNG